MTIKKEYNKKERMGAGTLDRKSVRIVGNTVIEEVPVALQPGNRILQLLRCADRIANMEEMTVAYIRLEEFQSYSEDRGIPVYTDVESLAIVMEDLADDAIRSCLIKGFYHQVDLTVIVDMQKETIRFNYSRFTQPDTQAIIDEAIKAL